VNLLAPFTAIAPPIAPCKVCGQPAPLFGVVDFHQTCAVERPVAPLPWSGIPIYYHRCSSCGFLFTIAFDKFSPADFARWVYNDQYHLADPEYFDARPKRNVNHFLHLFRDAPRDLRILDYGCGKGIFTRLIRESGFIGIEGYDPFVPEFSARPAHKFDLVISFEVVEHTPDPIGVFNDMCGFMEPGGILLFTTTPQPDNMEQIGLGWWYVAPRNGHISIHTVTSLGKLAAAHGLKHAYHGENNACFNVPPAFALRLFDPEYLKKV
jgi:2-polyprenyl-6-hydroxyphenyl methylase/3-demethylubiquinone-9 3-methyltransferase